MKWRMTMTTWDAFRIHPGQFLRSLHLLQLLGYTGQKTLNTHLIVLYLFLTYAFLACNTIRIVVFFQDHGGVIINLFSLIPSFPITYKTMLFNLLFDIMLSVLLLQRSLGWSAKYFYSWLSQFSSWGVNF